MNRVTVDQDKTTYHSIYKEIFAFVDNRVASDDLIYTIQNLEVLL